MKKKKGKKRWSTWARLLDSQIDRHKLSYQDFDLLLKLRTAVVINYILVLSGVYFLHKLYSHYQGFSFYLIIPFLVFVLSLLFLWLIREARAIKFSLQGVIAILITLNIFLTYHNGEGMNTGLLWSFVITIISIFLLGPAYGSIYAAISLTGVSILYYLDNHGHQFPHFSRKTTDEKGILLSFVIFLTILIAILTWLYEVGKARALQIERLKNIQLKKISIKKTETEKQLHDINQTLEERIREETQKAVENEKIFAQQAKMAAMGEMLGAIAHQWRQPLNTLGITVQDIGEAYETGELDKKYLNESIAIAMETIQHMSQTINDFRNFMQPSKEKSVFYITEAIKEALKIADAQMSAHHIAVELKGFEEKNCRQKTIGYPSEFKQVILNLLNNAKDAILEKQSNSENNRFDGKITVSFIPGKVLKIIIEDNGTGIPENSLKRIFEPYFTTKDPTIGTGIGLYLARKIIQDNMNGWVFAANGKMGAKFTVILKGENETD